MTLSTLLSLCPQLGDLFSHLTIHSSGSDVYSSLFAAICQDAAVHRSIVLSFSRELLSICEYFLNQASRALLSDDAIANMHCFFTLCAMHSRNCVDVAIMSERTHFSRLSTLHDSSRIAVCRKILEAIDIQLDRGLYFADVDPYFALIDGFPFEQQATDDSPLHIITHERKPLLLIGPPGSGKSKLVSDLAKMCDRPLIRINADDTLDAKDLIGVYTTSTEPGKFVFKKGALSLATDLGYWLVLEDIHLANLDIYTLLHTLLVTRRFLNKRVHPFFRILATTTSLDKVPPSYEMLFRSVMLPKLDFAILGNPSAVDLIAIVRRLQSALGREFGIREYSRLLNRLQLFHASVVGDYVSVRYAQAVVLEIADVLLSHLETTDKKLNVLLEAGVHAALNLSPDDVTAAVAGRRPLLEISDDAFRIGRVAMVRPKRISTVRAPAKGRFAPTLHHMCLLEQLAASVSENVPLLFVGETGGGKTSLVQFLADQLDRKLHVHNLNQQSDAAELIGGYRPVDTAILGRRVFQRFLKLFKRTFTDNSDKNLRTLTQLEEQIHKNAWVQAANMMAKVCNRVLDKNTASKKAKVSESDKRGKLWDAWESFSRQLPALEKPGMLFEFQEGSLTKAIREGHWLLLDELNLAPTSILERISAILDGSMIIAEEASLEKVERHPDFRLFACMNPSTDAGKKDLPPQLKSRFCQVYVPELLNFQDLSTIVAYYLKELTSNQSVVGQIVNLYLFLRKASEEGDIVDGSGHKPLFSLRTLARSLDYVGLLHGRKTSTVDQLIVEGLWLSFGSSLSRESAPVFANAIKEAGLKPLEKSSNVQFPTVVDFVITSTVRERLIVLQRAIDMTRVAVLLEGPTSAGKTSLVSYLAKRDGKRLVRINNHEHTDVAEYFGSYGPSEEGGALVFRDGPLVTAVRNGDWLLLDELNLAPSEVLEALNRLLDDNRELRIPETGEVVIPHPAFMLFATQNPVTQLGGTSTEVVHYGGRKALSKAFRNRFLIVHVDDLPSDELTEILAKRHALPAQYAQLLVRTMEDLQRLRGSSNIFAGKAGLVTARDLFKWAARRWGSKEDLATHGYRLLGERLRSDADRKVVQTVIESIFKVHVSTAYELPQSVRALAEQRGIVTTDAWNRMWVLCNEAIANKEPIILVGETGAGKTSVCDIIALLRGQRLRVLSCHAQTEMSDFVGSLQPTKSSSSVRFCFVDGPLTQSMMRGELFLADEVNMAEDAVLERLNSVLEDERLLVIADEQRDVYAHPEFGFIATMNPGGDFGKRELSPALRSRLTEIFVPAPIQSEADIDRYLAAWIDSSDSRKAICQAIFALPHPRVRDVVAFNEAVSAMVKVMGFDLGEAIPEALGLVFPRHYIKNGSSDAFRVTAPSNAPTTAAMLYKLQRALCLRKPVLVEGNPGMGKTASLTYLAKVHQRQLLRINLSEHTDMTDLVGSYVLKEGHFVFQEGPLLLCMRSGGWLLLDEINLATQSVLEGLNAVLDHRMSLFVPEIDETVVATNGFRVFASMNPVSMGGGRKGLPASFVNRFSVVYFDDLVKEDYISILGSNNDAMVMEAMSGSIRPVLRWKLWSASQQSVADMHIMDGSEFAEANGCKLGCIRAFDYSVGLSAPTDDARLSLLVSRQVCSSLDAAASYLDPRNLLANRLYSLHWLVLNTALTYVSGNVAPILVYLRQLSLSRPLLDMVLSPSSDTSDLIGSYDTSLEWQDSVFIKGMIEGSVVVVWNADLCPPSVLDRLNSVFEEDEPMLIVSEHDAGRVIRPHADFRCILVGSGLKDGRLSRAMVSRAAHVVFPDDFPSWTVELGFTGFRLLRPSNKLLLTDNDYREACFSHTITGVALVESSYKEFYFLGRTSDFVRRSFILFKEFESHGSGLRLLALRYMASILLRTDYHLHLSERQLKWFYLLLANILSPKPSSRIYYRLVKKLQLVISEPWVEVLFGRDDQMSAVDRGYALLRLLSKKPLPTQAPCSALVAYALVCDKIRAAGADLIAFDDLMTFEHSAEKFAGAFLTTLVHRRDLSYEELRRFSRYQSGLNLYDAVVSSGVLKHDVESLRQMVRAVLVEPLEVYKSGKRALIEKVRSLLAQFFSYYAPHLLHVGIEASFLQSVTGISDVPTSQLVVDEKLLRRLADDKSLDLKVLNTQSPTREYVRLLSALRWLEGVYAAVMGPFDTAATARYMLISRFPFSEDILYMDTDATLSVLDFSNVRLRHEVLVKCHDLSAFLNYVFKQEKQVSVFEYQLQMRAMLAQAYTNQQQLLDPRIERCNRPFLNLCMCYVPQGKGDTSVIEIDSAKWMSVLTDLKSLDLDAHHEQPAEGSVAVDMIDRAISNVRTLCLYDPIRGNLHLNYLLPLQRLSRERLVSHMTQTACETPYEHLSDSLRRLSGVYAMSVGEKMESVEVFLRSGTLSDVGHRVTLLRALYDDVSSFFVEYFEQKLLPQVQQKGKNIVSEYFEKFQVLKQTFVYKDLSDFERWQDKARSLRQQFLNDMNVPVSAIVNVISEPPRNKMKEREFASFLQSLRKDHNISSRPVAKEREKPWGDLLLMTKTCPDAVRSEYWQILNASMELKRWSSIRSETVPPHIRDRVERMCDNILYDSLNLLTASCPDTRFCNESSVLEGLAHCRDCVIEYCRRVLHIVPEHISGESKAAFLKDLLALVEERKDEGLAQIYEIVLAHDFVERVMPVRPPHDSMADADFERLKFFRETLDTLAFCIMFGLYKEPPKDEQEPNQEKDNEGECTEMSGMGMDEGSGSKDVTNEIEDESQIEGLKDDFKKDQKGDDEDNDDQGEEEENKPFEMQNDFNDDPFEDIDWDDQDGNESKSDEEENHMEEKMKDAADEDEQDEDSKENEKDKEQKKDMDDGEGAEESVSDLDQNEAVPEWVGKEDMTANNDEDADQDDAKDNPLDQMQDFSQDIESDGHESSVDDDNSSDADAEIDEPLHSETDADAESEADADADETAEVQPEEIGEEELGENAPESVIAEQSVDAAPAPAELAALDDASNQVPEDSQSAEELRQSQAGEVDESKEDTENGQTEREDTDDGARNNPDSVDVDRDRIMKKEARVVKRSKANEKAEASTSDDVEMLQQDEEEEDAMFISKDADQSEAMPMDVEDDHKDEEDLDDAADVESTDEVIEDEEPSAKEKKERRKDMKTKDGNLKQLKDPLPNRQEQIVAAHGWMDQSSLSVTSDRLPSVQTVALVDEEEYPAERKGVAEPAGSVIVLDDEKATAHQLLDFWKSLEREVAGTAAEICESIRPALAPTIATRLRGDYRTGKRINIKRIVAYIASEFRKDKIWLRRTRPAKRDYQVLLTVDNTLSMRDVGAARSACEALAVLVRAMTQLEIGQLAVSSWGESYKMLHGFGEPWGDVDACRVLEQLTFAQTEVKDADNLASMLASMDEARTRHSGADDLVQLCFVLSDGLIKSDNRNKIRALVRQAQEKRQVIVYVVLDPQEKITNMQRVSVIPGGGISRVRYLDVFPYSYYVLVHDIKSLGRVLGDALRQWLEIYHDQE